ncbi:MAG: hypothetical protein U5K33_07585 [Halofilum sp. (in: g-proteobacteria)]|nr:hypothetical protein [Halofilum sp. (in: g-proteobacteria)]
MPTRISLAERPDEAAPTAAMFAALVWVLHPVNTQAVTYVVQRMTALSVTFYLLALLAFVLLRRAGSAPGCIAFIVAAVSLPAWQPRKSSSPCRLPCGCVA